LLSRDISVTLLAPEPWHASAARRVGPLKRESVETWVACGEGEAPPRPTTARARRLLADDQAAFLAVAPPWALRGWSSYQVLIDQAIAFGVPHGSEFAALAWVVEQEVGLAALGVFTTPRFRRIGLGRAACLALIRALKQEGGRDPVWFTSAANEPSRALATALGFQLIASEPLSRWPLSNWSSETGRAT
jgi:GNAT superfamily N-acetyltransferase